MKTTYEFVKMTMKDNKFVKMYKSNYGEYSVIILDGENIVGGKSGISEEEAEKFFILTAVEMDVGEGMND